jgi:hypothetical protein
MPPAITEPEFNAELESRGFRIVRPGDPDFKIWGYIDIGGGVLVNRWNGGSSLASQLAYLISHHAHAPPPDKAPTRRAKKKGAKKNAT